MADLTADRLIASLAAAAGEAQDALTGALAALCPGGREHRFVQHRDNLRPWCSWCRYTQAGVKIPE